MLQESYLFVLCFSVSNLCSLYLIQKFSLFKNELKRIVRENETMRRNIDWTKSRGMAGNRYPKKKIGKIVNLFSLVVRCGLIVKPKIRNTLELESSLGS